LGLKLGGSDFSRRALREDGVAGVAVFGDDFSVGALMKPVMAAEATVPKKMPDVFRMGLPIGSHLRKEIGGIELLDRRHSLINGILLLGSHLGIGREIKIRQGLGDRLTRLGFRGVSPASAFMASRFK